MTPEQKSMEDVLKNYCDINKCFLTSNEKHTMISAMSEWASIQCAEKDKVIKTLKTQVSAYKVLTESGDKIRNHQRKLLLEAKTVDSEREMNAILTEELSTKDATIQELITALEASNELLVKDSYGQERLESNYQLIQKYKL